MNCTYVMDISPSGEKKLCGLAMEPHSVPGAVRFPQRLECPTHGYPSESRSGLLEHPDRNRQEEIKELMNASKMDLADSANPEFFGD